MRPVLLLVGVVLLAVAFFGYGFFPNLVVGGPGGPATQGNLVGYVTDTSTGSGIVGAPVTLSVSGSTKYTTSTTTAGYYKFAAITSGGYSIAVSATGYPMFQGSTGVSPGTTAYFNVQLAPLGSSGYSGGSGCTPLPTGGGCSNVPPPPPGVLAPPPPSSSQGTNATISVLPGNPKVLPVAIGTLGVAFIAIGLVVRRTG
ncbi:MAG TPA: carboxypeptidase-like regulatory domain-containing protein [Thermoplasmata archaeon]|nr:carboxypeptidase-like regulatory domain-containing protein [Thermoplasmata archaeon]